ncbi:hypothetical protein [Lentzea flava]|uniref:Immunity protein Imm1 n=1 Tax=Lentzea flava TaxID=103732 RepID=A0ABQ2VGX7_9PSEU|nr:hypothetical protein [Lentzea flava]MCP2204873.1 hypothetical protein [Lentzea flava]GGU81766.1 hypothetical protein GCM10010178_85520 [Lentzea flava]
MCVVGFFGTYAYEHGKWTTLSEGELPPLVEPFLWIDIHDSDITSVVYGPAGPGTGVAYLGLTPRTYFENPNASDPTDVLREAAGLAAWWALRNSGDVTAKQAEILGYLAEDEEPGDFSVDDEQDVEDADVFVEIKTARFLEVLGLPVPHDLG